MVFPCENVLVKHDAVGQSFVNMDEVLLGEGTFEDEMIVFEMTNIRVHLCPNFLFRHMIKERMCLVDSKTIERDSVTKNLSLQLQGVGIEAWANLMDCILHMLMNTSPSTMSFDVSSKRNPIVNTNSLKQGPVLMKISTDEIAVPHVHDKLFVLRLATFPCLFLEVDGIDEGGNKAGDGRGSEVRFCVAEDFLFCWSFSGAEGFEDGFQRLIVHSLQERLANDGWAGKSTQRMRDVGKGTADARREEAWGGGKFVVELGRRMDG